MPGPVRELPEPALQRLDLGGREGSQLSVLRVLRELCRPNQLAGDRLQIVRQFDDRLQRGALTSELSKEIRIVGGGGI